MKAERIAKAMDARSRSELKGRIPRRGHAPPRGPVEADGWRSLFESSPNPMWILDESTGRFLEVNRAAIRKYGYSRSEFLAMNPGRITGSAPSAFRPVAARRSRKAETVEAGECRHRRKDGAWLEVSAAVSAIRFAARRALLVVIDDLTGRRRFEKKLRRGRLRQWLLAQVAQRLLAAEDPRAVLGEVCHAVMEFVNAQVFCQYLVDPTTKRLRLHAFAGLRDGEAQTMRRLANGMRAAPAPWRAVARRRRGVRTWSWNELRTDGEQVGLLAFGSRTRGRFGREALALMGAFAEQVAAALGRVLDREHLRQAEERLRLALDGGQMGAWEWDLRTGQVMRDARDCQLLDLPHRRGLTSAREFFRRVHRADTVALRRVLRQAARGGGQYRHEFRIVRHDGAVRWLAERGRVLRDERGRPWKMTGVDYDVTARKESEQGIQALTRTLEERVGERTADLRKANAHLRAEIAHRRRLEEALREQEARLRALLESSPAAIVTFDARGVMESVNPACCRMFGYHPGEVLGRTLKLLLPSPDPWRPEGSLVKALRWREKEIIGMGRESRGLRKDGSEFPLFIVISQFSAGGRRRFAAFLNDITRRKHLEREILAVREREQQRIAGDLHDGLGQHLHALSYFSSLLHRRLKQEARPEAAEVDRLTRLLAEAVKLGHEAAVGLQPVKPVPDGLLFALRDLAERVRGLYPLKCHFHCPQRPLLADHAVATHLYRIAQEAVNNAVKHARPTSIRISFAESRGELRLGITDDGIGLSRLPRRAAGMGLHIMQSRADAINGSLLIRRGRARGTEVRVVIPRPVESAPVRVARA
jgi:two-component system sensor kinase FixL